MKLKKEYLVLGVIITALVAYLFIRKDDRTNYQLPVLEKFPAGDITKIRIKNPKSSIELIKKADIWVINSEEYPADTGKIKQLLEIMGELTLTALVSESESYDRYDLTDDKKISVKAWIGDTVRREFDLGKSASSFKHTFVKLTGDHRVYHARGSFRFDFDKTMDEMRNKTVLDFEIKDVQEILVVKNGQSEVYRRSEDTAAAPKANKTEDKGEQTPKETQPLWQRSTGESLDPAQVNRFLTMLDGLDCDEYIYDRKKESFKDPIYTLTLKGVREYTLSIFTNPDKEDKTYPTISSENAYPFKLTEFRAGDIMKTFDKKEEKKSES